MYSLRLSAPLAFRARFFATACPEPLINSCYTDLALYFFMRNSVSVVRFKPHVGGFEANWYEGSEAYWYDGSEVSGGKSW